MSGTESYDEKSPTELLIGVMDEFREAEPRAIVIVWTDEARNVNFRSSADGCCHALGLLEYAKENVIRGIFRDP